jgi:carbamoylphosphate synthase large subunit
MSATSGGTYEQKVDVEDLSGSNPVISKQSFTISGAAATSVRRYFTIEAIGKDGNRSARSQEVYWDFSIPNWILSPVNVIIKVEVQQQ